jgi:hypothetical protein
VNYKEWICFADEKPKENHGILIEIKPHDDQNCCDAYSECVKNKIFYGNYSYLGGCHYIVLEYCVTDKTSLLWKAHKDYDIENMYWFNNYHARNTKDIK